MCREGAWSELTVQVTLMGYDQRRMHEVYKKRKSKEVYAFYNSGRSLFRFDIY